MTDDKYYKSKKELVTRIYGNQKSSSKRRGHILPTYSKVELKEWLYSQELFHRLYDNWKRLDFQRDYAPSVDRKDDYIGYTIDNIQLMIWKENNEKYDKDKINGTNNKHNKSVDKFNIDGTFICNYHSIMEAERVTKVNNSDIGKVCRGLKKSAGGLMWKYNKNKESK